MGAQSNPRIMHACFHGWNSERKPVDETLLILEWIGGPPSAREWSNAHFLLGEALRGKFDSRKMIKLEFRGVPDTEDEYDIRCEILCDAPIRISPVRHALRGVKEGKKKMPASEVIKFEVSDPWNSGLSAHDEMLRKKFNSLPLLRRLRFWHKHIAPHFR
jgi:hypothetical protein